MNTFKKYNKVVAGVFYLLLLSSSPSLLTSCNDYLEVDAPSKSTVDFVFSMKSEVERALNGVYAQALAGDLYGNAYQSTFILNSDVDIAVSNSRSHSHSSYRRFDCDDQGGEILKFWTAAYNLIEYCNKFITYAEASPVYHVQDTNGNYELDAKGDSIVDKEMLQWIGEAKCLRAMIYHDLVVMFGDVPFTFVPTDIRGIETIPVVDREEIQKALIADLQKASVNMSSTASTTVERCSKEFAQGLIARIALTAGGYSLRPNTSDQKSYGTMQRPGNYQDYYRTAMNYADSVISAGTHQLKLSYQDVFVNECNYQVIKTTTPSSNCPSPRSPQVTPAIRKVPPTTPMRVRPSVRGVSAAATCMSMPSTVSCSATVTCAVSLSMVCGITATSPMPKATWPTLSTSATTTICTTTSGRSSGLQRVPRWATSPRAPRVSTIRTCAMLTYC